MSDYAVFQKKNNPLAQELDAIQRGEYQFTDTLETLKSMFESIMTDASDEIIDENGEKIGSRRINVRFLFAALMYIEGSDCEITNYNKSPVIGYPGIGDGPETYSEDYQRVDLAAARAAAAQTQADPDVMQRSNLQHLKAIVEDALRQAIAISKYSSGQLALLQAAKQFNYTDWQQTVSEQLDTASAQSMKIINTAATTNKTATADFIKLYFAFTYASAKTLAKASVLKRFAAAKAEVDCVSSELSASMGGGGAVAAPGTGGGAAAAHGTGGSAEAAAASSTGSASPCGGAGAAVAPPSPATPPAAGVQNSSVNKYQFPDSDPVPNVDDGQVQLLSSLRGR